jgi:sugar/nucleoside kinase (ribokinase family)
VILDLVAVGDSTVDVVIPPTRFFRGNEDSLHSTGMERHMGGSSNYLKAASRLGLRVGIADAIGDDDLGSFYRAASKLRASTPLSSESGRGQNHRLPRITNEEGKARLRRA